MRLPCWRDAFKVSLSISADRIAIAVLRWIHERKWSDENPCCVRRTGRSVAVSSGALGAVEEGTRTENAARRPEEGDQGAARTGAGSSCHHEPPRLPLEQPLVRHRPGTLDPGRLL